MSEATKTCSKCGEAKSLDKFYKVSTGVQGVMPYCKKCDNARARKITGVKVNRMRARHRAVADLIKFHEQEYETLLAIRLAEAKEEAEELAATPEAAEHFKGEPVRLKPGPRMDGEKAGDRIDVARCPHCIKHHDRGHTCESCGASPDRHMSQVSRNQKLVSSPKDAPSGVRPRLVGVDVAALAEFNQGAVRAARSRP